MLKKRIISDRVLTKEEKDKLERREFVEGAGILKISDCETDKYILPKQEEIEIYEN